MGSDICRTSCVICVPGCDYLCPDVCASSPSPKYNWPPFAPVPRFYNDGNDTGSMSTAGIVLVCLIPFFFLGLGCFFMTRRTLDANASVRAQPDNERHHEIHIPAEGTSTVMAATAREGLPPEIIDSIATFIYKTNKGSTGSTECSVCLGDFEEDEAIKLLPKCCHAFHTHCIDAWLRSHTNCPLCRARIISDHNLGSTTDHPRDPNYNNSETR